MTDTNASLKACPWCGQTPEYVRSESSFATLDEALLANPDVRCRTPKCPVRFFPTAMTIGEWNTRTPPESSEPSASETVGIVERLRRFWPEGWETTMSEAATLIEQQAATIAELEARDREIAHKLQDARTTLTKRAYGLPAITGDNLVLPPDAFDSIVRSLDAARAALAKVTP